MLRGQQAHCQCVLDFSGDGSSSSKPLQIYTLFFGGFSSYEEFVTLLIGVAYSVSKSESTSSSEVRNYDHHRWEPNKQMKETNTPCVPIDVFLFYQLER